MTDAIIQRHTLACDLARRGGAAALDFFNRRDTLAVEAKATPQDVVSRADREVEVLIRKVILAAIIHEAPVLARGAMFEGPLLLDAHR